MLTPIDIFALVAVMAIGLPHGAFDGAIAFFLGAGRSVMKMTGFLVAYSLLAGLYIGFWAFLPMLALGLFLILSIIHFGSGDIQPFAAAPAGKWGRALTAVRITTHGGIVGIVLPALHMQEVAGLYAALTGTNAEILMAMTALLLPVWMAGFAIYVLASLRYGALRGAIIEIGVLCCLAGLLPPLAGFAVYFCLVHSRRHFLFIWTAMQEMLSRQKILTIAILLTLATWIAAGLAFYLQRDLAALSASEAGLRTVFIALAALTVPHMLLVDGLFRPVYEKRGVS
ncbi:MAG: Brp/Blh family beta-carotene 15,15'-dioxygenase [Candidatus Puniceispirillaceae bacterium]|jgi:Brp/Blh family beta-carotene 15,15'-monooxygenase